MFARCQGTEREVQVKSRRHRDDDAIGGRVVDRGLIVAVAGVAVEPAAIVVGFRSIAAS